MIDYKIDKDIDSKGTVIWKDSEGDVWYEPHKVNYSKVCIRTFILPNFIELERGYYPMPPKKTGYTDSEYRPYVVKTTAYFEFCECIVADINLRISLIPQGIILKDKYTFHASNNVLCKQYGIMITDLRDFISCRLAYIAGKELKKTDFKTWSRTSWRRWKQGVADENSDHVQNRSEGA